MNKKLLFVSAILTTCLFDLMAQDTLSHKPAITYSFIKNEINVIHHPESLDSFFSKLHQLKSTKASVVNILHIGDSHIQADYLTRTARTLLQQEFGNAGLGLTFPGRIARTNESPLIYSSSSGKWLSSRLTNPQNQLPIGISGTTLKTELLKNTLTLKVVSPDYAFNRITLFFEKEFNSYHVSIKDSTGQELALAGSFTEEEHRNTSKIVLPYAIHQLQLETKQFLPDQKQFTLFGMSLSNSKPGILYSIIGANGAKFKHFSASKDLLNQTQALDPDLIIISLGTNEAVDHPDLDPKFDTHMDSLILQLNNLNPNAAILLTTPPEFYKKRTHRNPGIKIIKDKIIAYADRTNIPYWNLYEISGGNRSADQWKNKHLLQPDGIHFTKKGYDVQGHLLFEAILKGYHEYVRDRLPETH